MSDPVAGHELGCNKSKQAGVSNQEELASGPVDSILIDEISEHGIVPLQCEFCICMGLSN
jgi:hypothetical protein